MLILTEKPSVAAAFAAALGVPRKGPVWENADHCIVNALGHLLEDFSPEDYDPALKKWTLESLPVVPDAVRYKPIAKTVEQLEIVRGCFKSRGNGSFLLATDAEREGEIIGAEILDHVGFKGHAKARRFWVSEALTPDVIRAGIEAARPLSEYSSYREQGFARQHADWLVGMNLTRLLSLKCGKTLHVGRVQTTVLRAVYERDKSIEGFRREKYIEVTATLLSDSGRFSVRLVNVGNTEFPYRFPQGAYLPGKVDAAKETMRSGTVREAEKERKTVHPPKLYNLTSLQKDAHGKFSYTPEKTLELAQALYEKHKCLSYPRTPSRVMGDGNVELVKDIFLKLSEAFPGEAEGSDPESISPGNKRLFNSAELRDHHALVPLDIPTGNLSADERNVYMLVLQSFFRVLRPPHVYNSVKIKMDISGFPFAGNGVEVLHDGWKAFSDADGDEPEDREDFSRHREGQIVSGGVRQRRGAGDRARETPHLRLPAFAHGKPEGRGRKAPCRAWNPGHPGGDSQKTGGSRLSGDEGQKRHAFRRRQIPDGKHSRERKTVGILFRSRNHEMGGAASLGYRRVP